MYAKLIQGFGFKGDVGFAGGFLRGVFFHPGFPSFAGGGVASGEGEGGDVGVGDRDFLVGVFGKSRTTESFSVAAARRSKR